MLRTRLQGRQREFCEIRDELVSWGRAGLQGVGAFGSDSWDLTSPVACSEMLHLG